MGVDIVQINGALAFRDSTVKGRLYDAIGNNVVKYLEDFASWPVDNTTGDTTLWTKTITEAGAGDTTAVTTDKAGGALLVTCAANENDGLNMQLGGVAGENVKLDGPYPLYCGIKLAINDVDQTDLFFGVGVTDVDWSGGIADGLYFRSIDASAVVNLVLEKDSVESVTAVATLVDDEAITLEFYFDGENVMAWVNGVKVATIAATAVTFPNNEELRLTFEFLTGEATANTATVEWIRMVHIR
ncbi:MAG: hypothetical protein E4H01_11830 [Lysobacterales bacterium]|nr:MAG: hypothetical protein E4H01_11830 [Xanthomonadales bacterium]